MGEWRLRAVSDPFASDRKPLQTFDLPGFPSRRVIRPGWKML
jgi:hypothetical protein